MPFDRVNRTCFIVFVSITALCSYLTYVALSLYQSRQDFFMAELITAQSSAIERRLERSLSSTRILALEVRQQGGLFPNFEGYADEIIQSLGGISNLQLAPDGIIRFIHPLAGNEKAIGHNILKDDQRRKEALMALQEQEMTLAGPFELIQGGVAVIGRNPVFLNDSATGEEHFWGFASALIYLDDLLAVTELDKLSEKGYAYQLSRIHPDHGELEVFASSADAVEQPAVKVTVKVPNSEWFLQMSAPAPVSAGFYVAGYLSSALAALIIVLLLRKILLQPKVLQQVVDQQTRELQHLVHHDPLTGLPNRVKLKEVVERALVEYERYHCSNALLIIDLDGFKQINDLCGHDAGDAVLQQTARRLQACTRDVDTVARMGGDEFGIVIQHTDSSPDVARLIERILISVKQPQVVRGYTFTVSASIGIAIMPRDGQDYMSLYKHADMAMYAAKATGKNTFRFYDESLQVEAVNRIRTQQEICQALDRDELELFLQPIVAIENGQLAGYEALMRWNHPERGLVPPDQFIGVAESSDTIFKLGYWAFAEACRLIQDHNIAVTVSVNLSPRQFRDPNLEAELNKALSLYRIEPAQLELELTESCFIDDIDNAIATMHRLKEMGLSLALDDFGTGYSSLTLLQRLPVNKLKIDRSFVSELTDDERDKNIVQGLNEIAHKLDLTVVAEGIETIEQLELLQSMGCDLGQGYYFKRPQSTRTLFC